MRIIDTHVHYYPCFDQTHFFDSAYNNFQKAVVKLGLPEDSLGTLCLTESANCNFFQNLSGEKWKCYPTDKKETLLVQNGSKKLELVAGRQIVTEENVEVLAIGTVARFDMKKSLTETLKNVESQGAIAIIPWGFGKWIGRRGKIVKELILSENAPKFLLGDNGGRPHIGEPPFFKLARDHGIPILPGSDPLSFKSQEGNAGRCGVIVKGDKSIQETLLDLPPEPMVYGKGESLLPFIFNQSRIQIRKRFR